MVVRYGRDKAPMTSHLANQDVAQLMIMDGSPEPKVWLEAVFNGNSVSMYHYLETRSEYRRKNFNSGPPFVEPRRFDRDIGETISEGIVASWYEPSNTSNTSNTLVNKPQDDTKTQVP